MKHAASLLAFSTLLLIATSTHAQTYCAELRRLAQQCWSYHSTSRDPAHQACAKNYENAYTAYCSVGGPSVPSAGGNRAANALGALAGVMGMIAALGLTPDDVELPPSVTQPRDTALTEEQMRRLRHDADRELAEARRRCAKANPFPGLDAARGCAPPKNPFDPAQSPYWDSVKKRDCKGTIDFGRDGCIPDDVRRLLATLSGDTKIAIPRQTPANYDDAVLSVDQFRRLAEGEALEDVVAVDPEVMQAVQDAFVKKLEERTRALMETPESKRQAEEAQREIERIRAGSGAGSAPVKNPFDR